MLSILLCNGRSGHDALDFPNYSLAEEPPRKKPSVSSRKGAKINKLQIGAPSDSRHESHMGYDEVAGFDIDEYQQRIQTKLGQQAQQSPSPTSQSFSQNLNRSPSAARAPIKRKPAPPALPIDEDTPRIIPTRANRSPTNSASGSPTGSKNARTSPPQSPARSTYSASQPPSLSISKKALVPLFGEGGSSSNAPYVTETAKIRYDGAMAEIERALKESR